jgi:hypothetical protein
MFLHQRVLENRTQTLHDAMYALIDSADFVPLEPALGLEQCLLASQICYFFHDDKEMKKWIERAQCISGVEWLVTGALGKRTKFQQQDFAQLVLLARSKNIDESAVDCVEMPKEVALDHEVLLERMQLSDPTSHQDVQDGPLTEIDQCLLLSRWFVFD